MAKKDKCGNGHSKKCVDGNEEEKVPDNRFCPGLIKMMVPQDRGTTREGYVLPKNVADGAD